MTTTDENMTILLEDLKTMFEITMTILTVIAIPVGRYFWKYTREARESRKLADEKAVEFRTNVLTSLGEFKVVSVNHGEKLDNLTKDVKQISLSLSSLMDISNTAFFITDNKGNLTYCNDSLANIFGCKMEDMEGDGWLSYLHPEDRELTRDYFHNAVDAHTRVLKGSYRIINKDLFVSKRQIKIINECQYKAQFEYEDDALNMGVGTVWIIGGSETSDKMLKCIFDTLQDMKETKIGKEFLNQIKENKK